MYGNVLCKTLLSVCVSAMAISHTPTIQTIDIKPIEIIDTVELPPSHDEVITALKEEVRYTANWNDKGEDTTIQITQEDAYLLMKIAAAEAANQGWEGQLRVMEVVINRVNSPDYPNTIREVIMQPSQFQPVQDGRFKKTEPDLNSHLALAELEKNKNINTDIVAFEYVKNGATLLKYYDLSFVQGEHAFYIKKQH